MTTEQLAEPAGGNDFAELSGRIAAEGLFEARSGYYVLRIGIVGAAYLAALAGFLLLGDSWWQLAVAGAFAVVFAQVALVAHDLAHRQVFRGRRPARLAGWLAGNLGIGLSYGWWMDKHTRHHANPNHEDLDPDVDPDILVWSKEQAEASTGVPRRVGKYQAFLFFPLLTLEGFNLHFSSFRALRDPALKQRLIEGALLIAHVAGYLAALFIVLSPEKALAFLVLHQCLWGIYMGAVFAPGHKGMPTRKAGEKLDFFRRQVLTTRNVRGGWFVDTAMGGLNYQIEHHLFPRLPAGNLRRAQPIVRDYCAERSIPYCEAGLFESYAMALRHLHEAGAPIRAVGSAAEQPGALMPDVEPQRHVPGDGGDDHGHAEQDR